MRYVLPNAPCAIYFTVCGSHAAALYFIAAVALDAKRSRNSRDEDAQQHTQATYLLPLGILESLLAVAVFSALRNSLWHLGNKGSRLRLNLYRCFAACVALVAAACIGYLSYEAYFHATHAVNEKWQYEWVRF
jgi:Lung seven transmembrane receptor